MKKNFCKLMALVVVALMMVSTIAFANPAVDATDVAETTVTLTGLTGGEEATVLVVKAGTDLATLANSDIIYIDQLTIGSDGNVTFTMDVSAAAIADNGEVDKVDVYCGYTSMTGNALAALEVAVEEEVTGPVFNLETSTIKTGKIFGVNNSEYARVTLRMDKEAGLWTLTHSNPDSKIFYSEERECYDGLVKTTAKDVAGVIAEITAVKEVPVADLTIKMYGDVTSATGKSDGKINALDSALLKKYIKKIENNDSLGLKKLILADATGDSNINALDSADCKKYIKKIITEMTIAGK